MKNQLDALRDMTTVVADTGDVDAIKKYQPYDATTNPSLILKAASLPQYQHLIDKSLSWAWAQTNKKARQIMYANDMLCVLIGKEISESVPGKVSTEVDARLSFDTLATIDKARQLIRLYEEEGVDKSRILIKMASTWEGIKAAEQLEQEGIHCNLTLLFSFAQARACAEANVYLISPFVGRILDWYKSYHNVTEYSPEDDPGVKSVTEIYNYYKVHGYKTVVMGASFRNIGEIQALAGCDRLTISPQLLEALTNCSDPLPRKLIDKEEHEVPPTPIDEATFRWQMNQNAMATEKLAEGIRNFAIDQQKLENMLADKL